MSLAGMLVYAVSDHTMEIDRKENSYMNEAEELIDTRAYEMAFDSVFLGSGLMHIGFLLTFLIVLFTSLPWLESSWISALINDGFSCKSCIQIHQSERINDIIVKIINRNRQERSRFKKERRGAFYERTNKKSN